MKIKLTSNRYIGHQEPPYIIAELGSNHNGDMKLAKKLVKAAKEAGADCVKFQSWTKDTIFSRKNYRDNYFLADDYRNRKDYTLEEIVEKYSISERELFELRNYSDELEIDFTSTPFSKSEVDYLADGLNADFIKIASMDLNNYPFLSYIASKGRPVLLSTGLSTLYEIDKAIQVIEKAGNSEIVILHCISIYPPEDEQVNLRNMDTLSAAYGYPVGFSDHTLGSAIPLAAVAKGACVIEKHFTLDKNMEGWDHKISTTPVEMLELVEEAERIYKALGNTTIVREESDEKIQAFRRSIVAAKQIRKGEVITEDMIDYKRPGIGLSPEMVSSMLGKKARRSIEFDEIIRFDDF